MPGFQTPATRERKQIWRCVTVNSNSFSDSSCALIPTAVNGRQLSLRVLRDQNWFVISTMSTVHQKTQTVLWCAKSEAIIRVQREFRREHGTRPLMTRTLGDNRCNFERLAVWKKDILLGGLGDLMKMWIVLSRLSYGVRRSRSPEQVQSYRCRKWLSTEFFGRAFV
jgi:hypothetical protein